VDDLKRVVWKGYARAYCPCGTWVQRAPDGTLADGMAQHQRVVHGGQEAERG
jgi:hypothetical protein